MAPSNKPLCVLQKIPCEFNVSIPNLGHLNNNPGEPLKAGTNVSLPLWLAEMLALASTSAGSSTDDEAKSFVNLSIPDALSNECIQALKADPRAVQLRQRSMNFYNLATRVMELFEERELDAVMRKTFVTRAAEIALHARKIGDASGKEGASNLGLGASGDDFSRGMDEWERQLFSKAHGGLKAGKEWMDNVKKH